MPGIGTLERERMADDESSEATRWPPSKRTLAVLAAVLVVGAAAILVYALSDDATLTEVPASRP